MIQLTAIPPSGSFPLQYLMGHQLGGQGSRGALLPLPRDCTAAQLPEQGLGPALSSGELQQAQWSCDVHAVWPQTHSLLPVSTIEQAPQE